MRILVYIYLQMLGVRSLSNRIHISNSFSELSETSCRDYERKEFLVVLK